MTGKKVDKCAEKQGNRKKCNLFRRNSVVQLQSWLGFMNKDLRRALPTLATSTLMAKKANARETRVKHRPAICHELIWIALEKGEAPEYVQYINDIIVWGNRAEEFFEKGEKTIPLKACFAIKQDKPIQVRLSPMRWKKVKMRKKKEREESFG
ncbi:hypothetical protein BTVI_39470 [Pitangus sulphuratus]|nr:hypothetical protein BTVI_39470 [Pitangus sulphuratus]